MKKGYSCEAAPINTNVVAARDDYYPSDQTHVPVNYDNMCSADPAGLPPSCSPTMCDGGSGVEHMHGGYRESRDWDRRYGGQHRWGWNLPENQPAVRYYRRQASLSSMWLPIGVAVALLYVLLKKK